MTAPVVVVGAGIGGLACALKLAAAGVEVLVLEKDATVGGKLRTVAIDGQPLDAGPTVLTMRWVFDRCFDEAGSTFEGAVGLEAATTLARHAWSADEHLDLFTDLERSADAIGAFAGAAEAKGYRAFCARAESIYRTLEVPFMTSAQPNPLSLAKRVGWRGLGDLARISPFATLWSALGDYFRDERVRQLFGRYATYCGSSPFAAPATLMLVAHVEREGVWLVDGGMHAIAEAFVAAIEACGGRVRCAAPVAEIVVGQSRATGVRLADGERIDARCVVFNGDTGALAAGLLGPDIAPAVAPIARTGRSLSAVTWHLRSRTRDFPLVRHNVFFGADSRREFDMLFRNRALPDDPTVYVCAQDRDARDESRSRDLDGPERLMCLVNAPADADAHPLTAKELDRCHSSMQARLARCGLLLDPPTTTPVTTTPTDFAARFPATGGALYGRATHGWSASFERPAARSRIADLYLAGGSVHPGPGLPMAALSGRIAAESVLTDLSKTIRRASTSTSRPAATRGGTSTR